MIASIFENYKFRTAFIFCCVGFLLALSVITQIDFVLKSIDTDMDSYIHFVCAKRLIQNPGYFAIHWVWLPFYHYYLAGLILAGAVFETVRYINIALFLGTAVFFFRYAMGGDNKNLLPAFVSVAVFLLFPVNLLAANSAEPEILFSLCLLSYAIAMQRGKMIQALILLTIASLFRYESWAVWGFTSIYFLFYFIRKKTLRYEGSYLPLFIIAIPVLFVFGWAVLRALQKPPLFGFIFSTMDFAKQKGTSKLLQLQTDSMLVKFIYDISFYALRVPLLFSGVLILFSLAGLRETLQKHFWIALTAAAVLCFITLSWMTQANLGLNRHFVSIIPFYALTVALGTERIYRWLRVRLSKVMEGLEFRLVKFPLYLFVLVFLVDFSMIWYKVWHDQASAAFSERKEAVEFMATLPKEAIIFSNDSVTEVLSGRDTTTFRRLWIAEDKEGFAKIDNETVKRGEAYLLFDQTLMPLLRGKGEIVFRSNSNRDSKAIFYIMKFSKAVNRGADDAKSE